MPQPPAFIKKVAPERQPSASPKSMLMTARRGMCACATFRLGAGRGGNCGRAWHLALLGEAGPPQHQSRSVFYFARKQLRIRTSTGEAPLRRIRAVGEASFPIVDGGERLTRGTIPRDLSHPRESWHAF